MCVTWCEVRAGRCYSWLMEQQGFVVFHETEFIHFFFFSVRVQVDNLIACRWLRPNLAFFGCPRALQKEEVERPRHTERTLFGLGCRCIPQPVHSVPHCLVKWARNGQSKDGLRCFFLAAFITSEKLFTKRGGASAQKQEKRDATVRFFVRSRLLFMQKKSKKVKALLVSRPPFSFRRIDRN